jgi:uncharacterized protein YqjF (DUF2071 family)
MQTSTGPERRFLTAEWRHLAMLNYPVEREVLEPFVPKGTMLDTYKGVAYVSVVGLSFLKTRVFGVPVPGHRDFPEVNLRFYVRRFAGDDWRRGVVFIKEVVPRPAIAAMARAVYNERYVSLPMRQAIEMRDATSVGSVEYEWELNGSWHQLRATAGTMPATEPLAGSLEEFITEHHWGYARQRNGSTMEYRVEHPRWPVVPADTAELKCDIRALYGDMFVSSLQQPPKSAFVMNGSVVTVFRGRALK